MIYSDFSQAVQDGAAAHRAYTAAGTSGCWRFLRLPRGSHPCRSLLQPWPCAQDFPEGNVKAETASPEGEGNKTSPGASLLLPELTQTRLQLQRFVLGQNHETAATSQSVPWAILSFPGSHRSSRGKPWPRSGLWVGHRSPYKSKLEHIN